MSDNQTDFIENDNSLIHRKRDNDRFAMISNEILQDPEISSDAQMVATYLLSLHSDWKIKPKCIWKAKNIGRNRVYKAIDELCELGYMKKEVLKNGNLNRGFAYHLSAFKEFLRRSRTGDLEARGAETGGTYKGSNQKGSNKKKTITTSQSSNPGEKVIIFPSLKRLKISQGLKEEVSAKYTEPEIDTSVERTLAWKGRDNDEVGLRTVLERKGTWNDRTPSDLVEEQNRAFLETNLAPLDGSSVGPFKIVVGPSYVEFASSAQGAPKTFCTQQKDFISLVNAFVLKLGLDIKILMEA